MTTDDIYNVLTDAVSTVIPTDWTIAQLDVRLLTDGQDIECEGTYLTAAGEAEQLPTDWPIEVTEAIQTLYVLHKDDGNDRANRLQITLTAQGQVKAEFSWDQELQDEDDHFSNGGTAREWLAIREAKYGPADDVPTP